MVRLDAVLAFEDVGPDRALRQKLDAFELARFFGKDVDERAADDLALGFGIGNAGELIEEAVDRVHIDQVRVHFVAEHADDLLGLALSQQSVVDVHAGELSADRTDQKRRDDGRIDAAGQREKDFLIADLRADIGDLFVDERFRLRSGRDAFHGFGSCKNRHKGYLPK